MLRGIVPSIVLCSLAVMVAGCGDTIIPGSSSGGSGGSGGGGGPAKADPNITWLTPAPIINPTPLSATQLDASAIIPGTFVYTPAAGTVLPAGNQTLSVTFTPTDTTMFNTVTADVTLVVQAAEISVPVGHGHLAVSDTGNNRVLIYEGPFATNMSASVVLGQPDFTHNANNQGGLAAANTLFAPEGVAVDAAGDLWVADMNNCRVVEFKPPFSNNMPASVVLGEAGMTDNTNGPNGSCLALPDDAASGMVSPTALSFDSRGDLWVSDNGGNRVTEYVPPFTNGMAAAISIGQSSVDYVWASQACLGGHFPDELYGNVPAPPAAATSLCGPAGTAMDAEGNLWVANDYSNVFMQFIPPFNTGMAAGLEINGGPGSVEVWCPAPTASSFCGAIGQIFDSSGNLWFSDGYGRVLEYVPPFATTMTASVVLGQPNFTAYPDGLQPPTAYSLFVPGALSFDNEGNLFVPDFGFNRVSIFAPPFSNGMNAIDAIGQADLTSGGMNRSTSATAGPPAANTLNSPTSAVAF